MNVLIAFFCASKCGAGLSSENVVVVVNADSAISRTIANHYIELRDIPTKNVILLRGVPKKLRTSLKVFRESILRPILEEIDRRGIAPAVRTIAYSADFPTLIDVKEHHQKINEPTVQKYQSPNASLTGLTYFYRLVLADNPSYFSFGSNLYARGPFERHFENPFAGEEGEAFEQAQANFEEKKFEEAATQFQSLHADSKIPSLAIRAAEAFSEAGNDEEAIVMILKAVESGWWSKKYLEKTPSLAKHLDDERLRRVFSILDDSPIVSQGPIGFASSVGWTRNGSRVLPEQGLPYLCACSLAVTHPNGSTLENAVQILERASGCDRRFPTGRFAFTGSADVRAKSRFPAVADALLYLQANGFETEIFRSSVPKKAGPLLGMMAGTPNANLIGQPWSLVDGAIADNLTSYGAAFNTGSQTKLTEFLEAGAVMSSGAVAEPYSIAAKFPAPMMYGFYARGSSAIEAFYQSIASPYQLLIAGDPLAQPFARAPSELVDIELAKEGKKRVQIRRRSLALDVPKSPARFIELSINDRLMKNERAFTNVEINLPETISGVHQIRVTLVGFDRTEPRLSFVKEIDVNGEFAIPEMEILGGRKQPGAIVDDGTKSGKMKVKLVCKGADRIEVEHLGETLATVEGEGGSAEFDASGLGGGPLRFRSVAYFGEQAVPGFTVVDTGKPGA
ncbi:MAG: hypothetical protein AAF802_18065 [Planctomycetota bacterium]